jgi:tetratricopeptide (TPR) repeat protein
MHFRSSMLAVMVGFANVAGAQMSAADHVAAGDKEHVAMNAPAAYAHYEAALAVEPKNYEALWKAAREAVDVAEYTKDEKTRKELFQKGELYARRAVEANPQDAEGHFHMARALGRTALSMGTRDRIRLAGDIRAHALEALKLNPTHPGGLHVMGMWNAEIMRLNGVSRFMAKNFLGGQIFGSANWTDAVKYMEKSRDSEPSRIVHRLDLARIYNDVGNTVNAKAEYQNVLTMAATDYNDRHYKAEAAAEVKKIK